MKIITLIILLSISLSGICNTKLNVFNGSIDEALDSAKENNKDILIITKSYTCPVFKQFETRINSDPKTIKFLNSNFIIFIFDFDHASASQKKRLKKYYHSWRGFPQLYFIDKNENIIVDIIYTLKFSQEEQLKIWGNYKSIDQEWSKIKKRKRKKNLDFNTVNEYLIYRQIIYNSFDLIQISHLLNKYFKSINPEESCHKYNWNLIYTYTNIFQNPKIIKLVADNKKLFQNTNGKEVVSDFLYENYSNYLIGRREKKVNKMALKYPYNNVEEAKKALITHNLSKTTKDF